MQFPRKRPKGSRPYGEGATFVVRCGGRLQWTGSDFSIPTKTAETRSQFLIEAVYQERNPYRIDSLFIKHLLSAKLITAHPAGGINMDITTLEATKGLHVIGSMTRGVHFYCNSIDRNAAHAARIADS